MVGSGLEDVQELVYAKNADNYLLSGKALARAVRGHFLVDTALNSLLVKGTFNIQSITEIVSHVNRLRVIRERMTWSNLELMKCQ